MLLQGSVREVEEIRISHNCPVSCMWRGTSKGPRKLTEPWVWVSLPSTVFVYMAPSFLSFFSSSLFLSFSYPLPAFFPLSLTVLLFYPAESDYLIVTNVLSCYKNSNSQWYWLQPRSFHFRSGGMKMRQLILGRSILNWISQQWPNQLEHSYTDVC